MAGKLAEKVALITGAGGEIGAATAKLFAAEGARLVVNDVNEKAANATVAAVRAAGGVAIPAVADITSSSQVDAMFTLAGETFGGLDILVNNAFAAFHDVALADLREEDWDRTLAVCLKGPFLCARRALPMMQKRGGGSVVWISSVNALFGVGQTAYTAAKGGLISMARLVAADYAEWNIRSNVICPATISTEASLSHWREFPEGFRKLLAMYPLGRIGTPEEVAENALFLASGASSFVTGAVHVLDGGLLAGRKLEAN